jgi:hypothetical protein
MALARIFYVYGELENRKMRKWDYRGLFGAVFCVVMLFGDDSAFNVDYYHSTNLQLKRYY